MINGIESVLVGSANAKKLAEFYRDTVGLQLTESFEIGDDSGHGYAFSFRKSAWLYITDHSEVKGKSKNPERVMLNFEADDIESLVKKLKKRRVKVIRDLYHMQDYGLIATFADPDGNYFQLVKTRP